MAHKTVHGESTNSSVRRERLTNTLDPVMKRHQGEVRMFEVLYLVPWEAGDGETPKGAEWVWLEGQWHWWNTWRTSYTLPSLFQYSRGTSAEVYEYWCKRGTVVRPAKKTTQSTAGAMGFHHMKEARLDGRAALRQWIEEIKVELPKKYYEKYGERLREIPLDVLKQVAAKASAALLGALLNTRNRNCFMNPFMKQAKYLYPRSEEWQLTWAAMHDERGGINILDADIPESFRADVRTYWAQHLEELKAIAASGSAVAAMPSDISSACVERGDVNMAIACGSMIWMLTYACGSCLMAGKALTGWGVKPATGNRGHRLGCLHCWKNWERESMAAVVIHIIMDGKSCSFYSPWPLSWYVQQNWPEVYFKACHWIIERTTWYSKYDAFPAIRDQPPTDDPKFRLRRREF